MPKYDTKTLQRQFKSAASLRIRKKERGKDYTRDAGYWDGGLCDWGGKHNLTKDCETIAQGFSKLEELKVVEKELQKCTSEQEFNATKSRLARQAEEIERGLQVRTGAASSMFGICIIWADYDTFLESKLRPLRSELNRLKGNINNQQYKYYEEIKLLKLEQKQIENRMKENKRKAQSEKDPDKKALLLQMIEDDGKLLEDNLKKQKAIPASNLKFDPDKYVSDLIESMKEAIEKGGRGGSGGGSSGGRNRNKKEEDEEDEDDDGNGAGGSGSGSDSGKKEDKKENPLQNQQQLIIFGGIALLVIFYLYSQKEDKKEFNYYDF